MNKFQTLPIPIRKDSAPYDTFEWQTQQDSLNQVRSIYVKARPLLEFLIAFIGLILLLPVFFIIVILVKTTSRGPLFYAQERVGKDGQLFEIIKFRTMNVDAESLLGPIWAEKNDVRITNLGRILRSTHIDELPQLFNVIRGEMSIIGPRPERPFFVNKLKEEIPGYVGRLTTKPGITGLAQCCHGPDETIRDVQKKLRYDMLYIKRMCLALDVKIILRTLRVSISREMVE